MNRTEYLLNAFKYSTVYYLASWVFSVFTVTKHDDSKIKLKDYILSGDEKGYKYWLNNQWNYITDAHISLPLWKVEEVITIESQDLLVQSYNGPFPLRTRVGNLFVNYYCLVSAFGNKFPYQNGSISISNLEKMIAPYVQNDDYVNPNNDVPVYYVSEVKRFQNAVNAMAGFANIACPSATEYTVQPPPGIKEYKEKLLEEYKDKLNDPATIAMIDKKLVEYDKAFQAKDPDGGFYISDKAFNVSRKKVFLMNGLEQPEISGGKTTFIENSLSDGWNIDKMPAMIDNLRDGSYNRGAMTALGGEAVKFIIRIFFASKITEEDCGSTLGIPRILTDKNYNIYVGNTAILEDGKQLLITEETKPILLGKPIMVRSPGFCKTEGSNFCNKCLGEKLRGSDNSLAALASEVGSSMLYVFMKKMHGTALVTVPWDINETIK